MQLQGFASHEFRSSRLDIEQSYHFALAESFKAGVQIFPEDHPSLQIAVIRRGKAKRDVLTLAGISSFEKARSDGAREFCLQNYICTFGNCGELMQLHNSFGKKWDLLDLSEIFTS